MKKKILPLLIVISLLFIFSGCTSYNSNSRYDNWDWDYYHSIYNESDFVFYLETPIFDFSDAVNENGSVLNTTEISIPLTVENRNYYFGITDIELEITEFPIDLQIWSTSILVTNFYHTTLQLYDDYEFYNPDIKGDIPPGAGTEIRLIIRLDKTVEKSYSDGEIYVCHLEVSYKASYRTENVSYSPHGHKTIGFNIVT